MTQYTQYIVICLGQTHTYYLATRRLFTTWHDAAAYSRTIAVARKPIIVCGEFTDLQLPL